ncbi:hypothetical protein [Geodermatophilus sp. URMC 64]
MQIQVAEAMKGTIIASIRSVSWLITTGVLIDEVEVNPGKERVVLVDAADQRFRELRDLDLHPALAR